MVAVRVIWGEWGGAAKWNGELVGGPVSREGSTSFLTVHDQLVGDGVVAERVLNVARVFAGVGAVHFLDEQRSLGQLSQPVAGLENGATHFPRNLGRGYTDGQAR